MKRSWIFLLVPVLVVGVVFMALLLSGDDTPEPILAGDFKRQCSLNASAMGAPLGGTSGDRGEWTIFISDLNKTGPRITVAEERRVMPPGVTTPSCRFDITRVPGPPLPDKGLEGVDWRIGHTFTGIEAYRGGRIHVTAKLRADRTIRFGDAYLYTYDGKNVGAIGKIDELNESWKSFDITQEIDGDSVQAEVWLRLTIHAPISTTGSVYLNDVRVEFLPPATR